VSGQACYGNALVPTDFGPTHECNSGSCVGYRCV
jgi:hypothetical protein